MSSRSQLPSPLIASCVLGRTQGSHLRANYALQGYPPPSPSLPPLCRAPTRLAPSAPDLEKVRGELVYRWGRVKRGAARVCVRLSPRGRGKGGRGEMPAKMRD